MNIFYPDILPIFAQKQSIIEAIQKHQVIVIAGDTGSGKTTQIPKMCMEALPESNLLIGCTQPRRIAASTVSARVSEELGALGHCVGYKIRFHDHTSSATKIKFMTDGVLLAETRNDRLLSRYGVLIIDEAHERSLNIDFLIGFIKQLLPHRPDLKVIITSATIDTTSFAAHFNNAPIITVAGRTYPVTVRYCPQDSDDNEEKEGEIDHCVQTISKLLNTEPKGDILVFLPTERDIRECCQLLENKLPQAIILPMFGRLQAADQKKIFQPFKQVKIVVATNVAETSITVPGIRYVIDSGLARISYYNNRSKTTSLPIRKISKASCEQRKGRSGRIGPGICIRLYSEEDYDSREEFTLPELQRSNLAEVILQMISLELGKPEKFPFLDAPLKNAIREGYRLLRELGALKNQGLSKHGKIMADLPIDPCISRILIEANDKNCLREVKIIASVLAIQDPRIRPAEKEKEADKCHKLFAHPQSDFMALLNIWNHFHQVQDKVKSWSRLKKYCKAHYLSFQRMREWLDLHEQIDRILAKRKTFIDNEIDASYEQIHTSLLTGFLRNIALKKQGKIYQGAYNKELMIFPGSHQFLKSGRWITAASFIETSRLYALTVATIEPEWIEPIAKDFCKYSWSNPHWQKKTGQIIATETVSLFGLIIMSGRKVNFGKRNNKNVAEARDIFIQSALILGELNGSCHFLNNNLALIKRWQETEEKMRVRDITVDESTLHEFYSTRLPPHVYDQRTLNIFLKKRKGASLLHMAEDDVVRRKPGIQALTDYPPCFSIGSLQIRLEYHFEPGSDNDGVTFRLPLNLAPTVNPGIFEWLVPGLLHEKITVLLKALPKSIRKKLVPISETVDRLLDDMDLGSGSLYSSLEQSILKQFRLLIGRSDWTDGLPAHLMPRFLLFDDIGDEICSGRNLKQLLNSQLQSETAQTSQGKRVLRKEEQEIVSKWEGTYHTTCDFSGLPPVLPCFTQHNEIAGFLYPALVSQPDKGSVQISFEKNKKTAEKLNSAGLLFFYQLHFSSHYKSLKKYCTTTLSGPSALWLLETGKSRKEIVSITLNFIMRSLFFPITGEIEDKNVFDKKVARVKNEGLLKSGTIICDGLMALFRRRRSVQDSIQRVFAEGRKKRSFLPAEKEADFKMLLKDIFPFEYLTTSSHREFDTIDRQLQSLSIRLERFSVDPAKDAQKEKSLLPHLNNLAISLEWKEDFSEEATALVKRYREMVDEFRISLFSPEIKTREPISLKRLDQQWRSTRVKC